MSKIGSTHEMVENGQFGQWSNILVNGQKSCQWSKETAEKRSKKRSETKRLGNGYETANEKITAGNGRRPANEKITAENGRRNGRAK
jgi:hypothetical protein